MPSTPIEWPPPKPEGSPFTAHPQGYWCKKINGRLHYFGRRYASHDEALAEYTLYLANPEAYIRGDADGAVVTVFDVCNEYAHARKAAFNRGEIASTTYEDYRRSATKLTEWLGKTTFVAMLGPSHFRELLDKAAAQGWGPTRRAKFVGHVRSIFAWAGPDGMRLCGRISFGPDFKPPSAKLRRRARRERPKKLFAAAQIRKLLNLANPQLEAMILLGINGGFGNTDCSSLPHNVIDYRRRLIEWPRPKTEIERVVPLWPRTITAIKAVMENRRRPLDPDDDRLVFLTATGRPWVKKRIYDVGDETKVSFNDAVAAEFRKLLNRAKLHQDGLGFYTLRHTFETRAGEAKDPIAVSRIMGHEITGTRAHYIEEVSLKRLRAVTRCVHRWLFGSDPK